MNGYWRAMMLRRFLRRTRMVILLAAAWAAVYYANTELHRRAYEQLLAGNLETALASLRFVVTVEPNFFLHRGAMGRKAMERAFREAAGELSSRRARVLVAAGPLMSSPAADGNAIYVGDNGDFLMKIDADSFKVLWKYKTGGDIETQPLVAPDGKVYVAAHDGLHVVDPEMGKGRLLYPIRWGESSPAYATGTIFVGTDSGQLLALDAGSGALKWAAAAAGPVESSPAVSGGRVFFGCNKGVLYAVDAESGLGEWEKLAGGRIEGRPLVMGDSVFVGTTEGKAYSFDVNNGGERWERNLGGSIQGSAAGADGIVAFGTMRGDVFGLDVNNGSVLWVFRRAGPVEAGLTIDGGTVYATTHYGFLHAVDLKTGKRLRSFLAGWDVDESAPLVHDGRVYFGAMDGRFYSVEK